MDDIRKRVEYYRIRAQRKARSHYLAAKRSGRKHAWLGVPVVVISTVVGSTIFASITENPAVGWKIFTGLLSISAAVLAALQTFFKFSELSEKHRISAAGYASLKRRLDSIQLRFAGADGKRDEYINTMESIVSDIDQLEAESPDVPDDLYDVAVKEQLSDEEGV